MYDSVNCGHRILEMYTFPKLFSAPLNPISHAENLSKNQPCERILFLTSSWTKRKKRRLSRNRVKLWYRSNETELLVSSHFHRFLMWNCFFEYEHPFVNKKVAITEPAVISARLLRLVSNGIVSTCKACSTFSNLNSSRKEMKGYPGKVGKHSQRRHWQPN